MSLIPWRILFTWPTFVIPRSCQERRGGLWSGGMKKKQAPLCVLAGVAVPLTATRGGRGPLAELSGGGWHGSCWKGSCWKGRETSSGLQRLSSSRSQTLPWVCSRTRSHEHSRGRRGRAQPTARLAATCIAQAPHPPRPPPQAVAGEAGGGACQGVPSSLSSPAGSAQSPGCRVA